MNERLEIATKLLLAMMTADWKFPIATPAEWDAHAVKRAYDLADRLIAGPVAPAVKKAKSAKV